MRTLALVLGLATSLLGDMSAEGVLPVTKSPDLPKQAARLIVAPAVIFPKLVTTPKDFTAKTVYMTVAANLYIENCGTTPITIPTRISPDGKPMESWTHGPDGDSRGVYFRATYNTHGGKKVQPSPVAFEPVTLQPGEQAQVGHWAPQDGYRDTLPDELRYVTFTYEVADDLAARFGWWAGNLEAKTNFVEILKKFRGDRSSTEATANNPK